MLNVVNIGRYSSAGRKAPCRSSDTRWLKLRLNVDSSAHAAISAPRVSARSLADISTGCPASKSATKSPGGCPAVRAAARTADASARDMRNVSRTRLASRAWSRGAMASRAGSAEPFRASASAARTQPEGDVPAIRARSTSAAFRPCRSTLSRSRDEGPIPEPPDMRSVSDNGATAPISALTYAFSIGSDRGIKADDSEARIIAGRARRRLRVNRIDRSNSEA